MYLAGLLKIVFNELRWSRAASTAPGRGRALAQGMRAGTPYVSPDGLYQFLRCGKRGGNGDIHAFSVEVHRPPPPGR